jgi:hypothetical protein
MSGAVVAKILPSLEVLVLAALATAVVFFFP